jgi:phosphatidylserine/phosphatidylglycerophosphate/cardiolipin synthase-like enzyme
LATRFTVFDRYEKQRDRMDSLTLLGRGWENSLRELISSTDDRLLISSPYITTYGCDLVVNNAAEKIKNGGEVVVLTDLSPMSMCQGSTDPAALRTLTNKGFSLSIRHLPRLHAKVYIADERTAIITSGNFSVGGLIKNYEYGLRIADPMVVQTINSDITSYSALGAVVSEVQLATYCEIANEVRVAFRQSQASIARTVRRRFDTVFREAEDELVRLRLAGGAMHTVFAKTILYLLRTFGPFSTVKINGRVEAIHPDLCDNNVDRVIDGRHFGKKWKHAVRTAQQQLKKQGLIELVGNLWRITNTGAHMGVIHG